jgi:hypothetical protein
MREISSWERKKAADMFLHAAIIFFREAELILRQAQDDGMVK